MFRRGLRSSRRSFALLVAAPLLLPLLTSCSSSSSSSRTSIIDGRVVLRGLSQHSGVVVSLSGPSSAVTLTDPTGAFRFPSLPPGAYAVTATAPSTTEHTLSLVVNALPTTTTTTPDLVFSPLGAIRGRAALADPTGVALSVGNAGIVVVVPGTSSVATTDDAGRYLLEHVPVGARDVVASSLTRRSAIAVGVPVAYAGGTTPEPTPAPDLLLSSTDSIGSISGKVLLGAAPAPGVAITVVGPRSAATVTDAAGAFSFPALPDGAYVVSTSLADTAENTRSQPVSVSAGSAAVVADLVFTPTGTLAGFAVLDDAPHGNAGIVITATRGEGAPAAVAQSGDDGSYVLRGVPAGAYTVSAARAGYTTRSAASVDAVFARVVDVPRFSLLPAAGSGLGVVNGSLKAVGRGGAAGFTVSLRAEDPAGGASGPALSALTDANGVFNVRDVPAGLYGLTVSDGAGYDEHLPNVLALPGAGGLLLGDGVLFPLRTIEVQRARRLASLSSVGSIFAAPGGAAFLVFTDDDGGGNASLWLVRNGGAGATAAESAELITSAAQSGAVWFSPSGDDAYFFANVDRATSAAELWRLPISRAQSGVPAPPAAPVLLAARVSTEATLVGGGARLLVVEDLDAGLGTLALVELATGTISVVAQPVMRGDVRISADTRRLVYVRDPEGVLALETVDVLGGAPRVLATGVDRKLELVEDPAQPTQPRVLFFSRRAGRVALGTLYAAPLFGSGAATTLGVGVLPRYLRSVAPARLAFWSDFDAERERAVLRIAELTTGAVYRVGEVSAPGGEPGDAVFSADGASVAFFDDFDAESREGTLKLAPTTTTAGRGVVTVGTRVALSSPGAPRFTADARRIVYSRALDATRASAELRSADATTGASVLLAEGAALAGTMFVDGGASIVYLAAYEPTSSYGTLSKIAVDGSGRASALAYRVVPPSDDARGYPVLAGGSDLLALTDFDPSTQRGFVCRVPLANPGPSVLATNVVPHLYALTPDGAHVLIVEGYDAARESGTLRALRVSPSFAAAPIIAENVWLPEYLDLSQLAVAGGRVLVVTDHVRGMGGTLRAAPLPGMTASSGEPMGRSLGSGVELADASFSQGGASALFRAYDQETLSGSTLTLAETADSGATRALVRRVTLHGETADGAIFAVRAGVDKPFGVFNGVYLVAR